MRVLYTAGAVQDLDEILAYIGVHYPSVFTAFEDRLRLAERRIGTWPESAPLVDGYRDIRALALLPYPYRLFYRVSANEIEILYLHHAARQEPWKSAD